MHELIRRMTTPISTPTADAAMGARLLYAFGIAFVVLGGLTLARVGLDAAQLVLGLLLVLGVAMQLVVAGLVVDMRSRLAVTTARAARR